MLTFNTNGNKMFNNANKSILKKKYLHILNHINGPLFFFILTIFLWFVQKRKYVNQSDSHDFSETSEIKKSKL